MNGKGSNRRPYNVKKYNKEYKRIFSKKRSKRPLQTPEQSKGNKTTGTQSKSNVAPFLQQ